MSNTCNILTNDGFLSYFKNDEGEIIIIKFIFLS